MYMKRLSSRPFNNKFRGMIYISPWLIGFAAFQFYPLLASLYYSFTDFNMLSKPNFIGLKNYIDIFTSDTSFMDSVKATFKYVIAVVPCKIIFALVMAVLLNAKLKTMNFYRTIYYLPSILGGSVAVSLLWRFMFMKEGTVNMLLGKLGIASVGWLSDPGLAIFTLGALQVWQFGSPMVLFLAALKQVPSEMYESAKIDGSSPLHSFFKITLPFITPIVLFNIVMQTNNAFQEFTAAFIVTNGGPMHATYLYAMKLYEEAFNFYKMGYASALSWILFIVIFIFTIIIFKSANLWVFYEDKEE